uniref:PH domain-containing protein n=1 Tax=Macrostomum lignano TaxID=282301 RepID=A0A1I8FUI4_9PLAT
KLGERLRARLRAAEAALSETREQRRRLEAELAEAKAAAAAADAAEGDNDGEAERTRLAAALAEAESANSAADERLKRLRDCDPAALDGLLDETRAAYAGANRWTDNAFALSGWLRAKFPATDSAAVAKQFGIAEDLDYVARPDLAPSTEAREEGNKASQLEFALNALQAATGSERAAKEGGLHKWTNYLSGWQPRWFRLSEGSQLSYYLSKEEVSSGCRGSVNISVCDVLPSQHDPLRFDLSIPGEQLWHLRATTQADRQSWIVAIAPPRPASLTGSGRPDGAAPSAAAAAAAASVCPASTPGRWS